MQPIFDLFMVKDTVNPVKIKIILLFFLQVMQGKPCRVTTSLSSLS